MSLNRGTAAERAGLLPSNSLRVCTYATIERPMLGSSKFVRCDIQPCPECCRQLRRILDCAVTMNIANQMFGSPQ